ncbi:MAG: TraB/GumN family protein [Prevotella sp.]|nr:TraB/GumN family protein [Prevotella sp.]
MNKKTILSVISFFVVFSANAQLLFRISGNGLEKPSYILGTIHNLSGSLLDSIPEYLEAESQCQQMYVEHKPSATTMVVSLGEPDGKQVQQEVDYPDGKNIFDVIDEESAEILVEKYNEYMHINLSDTTWKSLWKITPAAFQNLLTSRFLALYRNKGSMDYELMEKVQERGWNVGQLDDERIKWNELFEYQEKLPQTIEEQADSLMAFLKDYEGRKQQVVKDYESTCKYWRTGDYEGFVSHLIQNVNIFPGLLRDRNEKWLPRMITAMCEKPTMFVFGSAHLIGEHGIIQLLRASGYEVEQVKR